MENSTALLDYFFSYLGLKKSYYKKKLFQFILAYLTHSRYFQILFVKLNPNPKLEYV